MKKISLTDFIDFVSSVGTTKFSIVKKISKRGYYHPAFDFWKPLREAIIELHQEGGNKNDLDKIMKGITDKNKQNRYPELISQYKSFLGRKETKWFEPPFEEWKHDDLNIRLNPELGLNINGKPYIIKLYFKSEPLSKKKSDLLLLLIKEKLQKGKFKNTNFAILDIGRKKLFEKTKLNSDNLALLEAEANSLLTMWNSI